MDEDDNDDILVFGVPVHAFVSEVCFLTTMVVMAIIVVVVGGGCKRASGLINARFSLKLRENLRVSLRMARG